MSSFTIVQDTREQTPWDFSIYKQCNGSVVQGLKEGDYTTEEILNLENKYGRKILRIERKRSTAEIANNLGKKYKAFENEMDRLSCYEHAYILCEFTLDSLLAFPKGSTVPKHSFKMVRMNGKFMHKRLREIEEKYGVKVLYCNNTISAIEKAIEIFQKVHNVNSIG